MKTIPLDFGNFDIEIVKKNIKNIYFRVYPLKKTVVVTAPDRLDSETLRRAILSKKEWILRQINKGSVRQPSMEKTYAAGEEFLFKGKTYPIAIIEQDRRQGVVLHDDHIRLIVSPCSGILKREILFDKWCRKELKKSIHLIIEKWQPLIGVKVRQFGVRKMKTRWGSCNINAARIWLNLKLIHLHSSFLEYVIVHEMVHLLERGHNDRFKGFMDRYIPDWRNLRKELRKFSL